jgi:hypothetical protein
VVADLGGFVLLIYLFRGKKKKGKKMFHLGSDQWGCNHIGHFGRPQLVGCQKACSSTCIRANLSQVVHVLTAR